MSGPSKGERRRVLGTSIHWTVPPARDVASRVRELLIPMCRDVLEVDELDSVAMVAHELLENLFKYSAGGDASFDLELFERSGDFWVQIQTRNRAGEGMRRKLAALARSLETAGTPGVLYDQLIARSPYVEGSGLGLARISAEGSMKLTVSIEGDEVTLDAVRRVAGRRVP